MEGAAWRVHALNWEFVGELYVRGWGERDIKRAKGDSLRFFLIFSFIISWDYRWGIVGSVDGRFDGELVGLFVGGFFGELVGEIWGPSVGELVGEIWGLSVGELVGEIWGLSVVELVGTATKSCLQNGFYAPI